MTVLDVALQWPSLDPATDTQDAVDAPLMNAIYGQLFEAGPHGTIIPSLASGYQFSDHNLLVTITIRHGIKFQDGTAFNAQAVEESIQRDLTPANACICDSDFTTVTSVTTSGSYHVLLHLSVPHTAVIASFIGEAPNWTVSPTALASEGETTFGQRPIGAGPFEVESNSASAELLLQRFGGYWQKGRPYLDSLEFLTVGNDESAYESLQAGQSQVLLGVSTIQVIQQAEQQFKVDLAPGTTPYWAELNTTVAPFNNPLARQAIYYATNAQQILTQIGLNVGTVTESPSGPGSTFYEKKVPGYRGYNLTMAQSLVSQLGGLSVTIMGTNSPLLTSLMEALQQQWGQAGIKVTVQPVLRTQVVQLFATNNWEINMAQMGGVDPSYGILGLSARVSSAGTLSGVRNAALDGLMNRAAQLANSAAREKLYFQVYKAISDNAYGPFLYVSPTNVITAKSVTGLTTGVATVDWENVALK